MEAEQLPGSRHGRAVWRIGSTIRRAAGPSTPTTFAILRHLEVVGFDGAPRALGIDDQDREILSYIPGVDGRQIEHTDETLRDVGRLIRGFHRAIDGFVPPVEPAPVPAEFRGRPVMCHNDLAPYNTIYASNRPIAFIDWELARPAPPLWDLAHAAWSFVPLYTDEDCERIGLPVHPRGPRLRSLCDGYELDERGAFLDLVRAHLLTLDSPFARRSVGLLDASRTDWERCLG
jgi:hypothetical protein